MRKILFSSVLKTEYYSDLESLLFFNPQQEKVQSGIIDSLEKFGQPEIMIDGDRLRIKVGEIPDVQALFGFDKNDDQEANLAGMIVFLRADGENLIVLHVAVKEEYSVAGIYADEMLVMRFFTELRKIGHRIQGVRSITYMYDQQFDRIPV